MFRRRAFAKIRRNLATLRRMSSVELVDPAGWLVGWLASCVGEWVAGWLAGNLLAGWLAGWQLAGWLAGSLLSGWQLARWLNKSSVVLIPAKFIGVNKKSLRLLVSPPH